MSDTAANETAWVYCEEKAFSGASPWLLVQPYLTADKRRSLLAVSALLNELWLLPDGVSETSIGINKLHWWQQQLSAPLPRQGGHPVLAVLAQVSARPQLPISPLATLMQSLQQQMEQQSYATVDHLWDDCVMLGSAAAELSMTLVDGDSDDTLLPMGALRYFMTILGRISTAADNSAPWPVPLSLQARHQLNREQARRHPEQLSPMLSDLLADIEQRLASGWPPAGMRVGNGRHLLLAAVLDQRRLQRLRRNPALLRQPRRRPWNLAAAWAVWRRARVYPLP
ncbi:MAG TPA: hypothetical protein EYP07_04490 [Kiloniellaceae bacterium]|nr:hypothetical protein [Kiloniellaceae bacterium]